MKADLHHAVSSSLQAVPVALVFTKQLLLSQKASAITSDNSSVPEAEKSHLVRATQLTALLKGIQGYSCGGLND